MEKKSLRLYVVCIEEDGQDGIYTQAKVFATLSEAWAFAEEENKKFKDEYGDDAETEESYGSSIYTFTDDYYIYITVEEANV